MPDAQHDDAHNSDNGRQKCEGTCRRGLVSGGLGVPGREFQGFSDPAALAAACASSGAALACLCSSDKAYAQHAVAAVEALQNAGAKHIYLAGRPGEQEAGLRAAGVGDFIFAGGDALAMLTEAWRRMERA